MSITNFEELTLSLKSFNGELSDEIINFCLNNKCEVLEYFKKENKFLYEELSNTILYEIKPLQNNTETPTHFKIKTDNFTQIFNTFNSLIPSDNKIIWIKEELKEMLISKNISFKYNLSYKGLLNKIEQIIDIKMTLFNQKSLHKDIENLINILPDNPVYNQQIIEIEFHDGYNIDFLIKFKQWLSQNYPFENFTIIEGYSQKIFTVYYIEYWISNPNVIEILKNLLPEQKYEIIGSNSSFYISNPQKISILKDDEVDIRTIICPIKEIKNLNKVEIYDYYKQFNNDINSNYPLIIIDDQNITIEFSKDGKYLMDATNALIDDSPNFLGLENDSFTYKNLEE